MQETTLAAVVAFDLPIVGRAISDLLVEFEEGIPVVQLNSIDEVLASDGIQPKILIVEICFDSRLRLDRVEALRARFPKTLILVMSRLPEQLFAERALRLGANGYVQLTADINEIRQAIAIVFSGENYISGRVRESIVERAISSSDQNQERIEDLTERELQVFRDFGSGKSVREIAADLDLSMKTVETYRDRIKGKIGVHSSHELMRRALECYVYDSWPESNRKKSN